jgi:hypothetical protein
VEGSEARNWFRSVTLLVSDDTTLNEYCQVRPPDPIEADRSIARSEHWPILSGTDTLILGKIGSRGSWT